MIDNKIDHYLFVDMQARRFEAVQTRLKFERRIFETAANCWKLQTFMSFGRDRELID